MKIHFIHPAIGEIALLVQDESRVVIGRKGGGVGIELNWDRRISRRHASISMSQGQVSFEDLGSSNGSWYGGARIEGLIRLEPGMSILVGKTVLTISPNGELLDEDPWSVSTDTEGLSTTPPPVMASPQGGFETDDMTTKELDSVLPQIEAAVEALPDRPEPIERPKATMVTDSKVALYLPSRDAFRRFWSEELRRTGLFVETDRPPEFGTRVDIQVGTPDGAVLLTGSVVHVVSAAMAGQFSMAPGCGLELAQHLDPNLERQIELYTSGQVDFLDADPHLGEGAEREEQIALAQNLLHRLEAGRLYEAIDADPKSDDRAIRERLDGLEKLFSQRGPWLRPPQVARLDAGLHGLARIRAILADSHQRLIYDFRAGYHRVAERRRLAEASLGPTIPDLRRAWNEALPQSVEQAAELMRKAFAASQVRDLETAIFSARRALELNPFFGQLEQYITLWEKQIGKLR